MFAGLHKKHKELLFLFLENASAQNRSQLTIKAYAQDLERFFRWYEYRFQKVLKNPDPQIIAAYIHYLKTGGPLTKIPLSPWPWNWGKKIKTALELRPKDNSLAVNSQKRHMSAVKNFFEYLEQFSHGKGPYRQSPVKSKLHHIKLKDIDIQHTATLTKENWEVLNEATWRLEDRLIIHLLFYAGLRITELQNLKVNSINLKTAHLTIFRKGGKLHHYQLREFSKYSGLLKAHTKNKEKEAFVFHNKKGEKLQRKTLYARIKKLFLKANLPSNLSPHSFRKGCATELYDQTKDLLLVRDYLNHSDAKVTQSYIDQQYLNTQSQMLKKSLPVSEFNY